MIREYHAIGAMLRITDRACIIIPIWCPMIHTTVTLSEAARCLRDLHRDRVQLRKITRKNSFA